MANLIAFFHAYKFTHFASPDVIKTGKPEELSFSEKISSMAFGVSNPRPGNESLPSIEFETINVGKKNDTECWKIHCPSAKGTVILFHGFAGHKSTMLDKAEEFRNMGYHTMLVDFMGCGGSKGNRTTIGFKEAEQVKSCYDYLTINGEENIYLFGTSMGAVAIMKAINDYNIQPKGVILECPFGSMYQTVCARFEIMKVPTFPMAGLLVFWGGIQNGFWAFDHNPEEYAKKIHCPVLLFYGEQDPKVSREETDEIFANLKGDKYLVTFPEAGHENYLNKYKEEWLETVAKFLN